MIRSARSWPTASSQLKPNSSRADRFQSRTRPLLSMTTTASSAAEKTPPAGKPCPGMMVPMSGSAGIYSPPWQRMAVSSASLKHAVGGPARTGGGRTVPEQLDRLVQAHRDPLEGERDLL